MDKVLASRTDRVKKRGIMMHTIVGLSTTILGIICAADRGSFAYVRRRRMGDPTPAHRGTRSEDPPPPIVLASRLRNFYTLTDSRYAHRGSMHQ